MSVLLYETCFMCTRQAGPTWQALTNQVRMVKLLGNVMKHMEQLCIDLNCILRVLQILQKPRIF